MTIVESCAGVACTSACDACVSDCGGGDVCGGSVAIANIVKSPKTSAKIVFFIEKFI